MSGGMMSATGLATPAVVTMMARWLRGADRLEGCTVLITVAVVRTSSGMRALEAALGLHLIDRAPPLEGKGFKGPEPDEFDQAVTLEGITAGDLATSLEGPVAVLAADYRILHDAGFVFFLG